VPEEKPLKETMSALNHKVEKFFLNLKKKPM